MDEPTPQPAPQPTPDPTPSPEPSPRDKFISMLPEDLRGEGVFANFNSVDDLAKSYVSAAKMVGMDKGSILPIPRDDSKEAWDAVYNKLGRPESPDKYNLDAYKDAADQTVLKSWAEKLHGLGFNQKQVDGVLGDFFNQAKAAEQQVAKEKEARYSEWSEQVQKEYGLATDRKLDAAVGMVEKIIGDGALEFMEQNPDTFKDPRMVKLLVSLADKTGESSVLRANGSMTSDVLSPEDAMQQLNAMKSNPEYFKIMSDLSHPQHKFYVEQQQKLFDMAHPSVKK